MPSTAVFTMDYLNLLTYKFEISFIEGNFDMLRALVQTRVLVVHIDIQTIFLIFSPFICFNACFNFNFIIFW